MIPEDPFATCLVAARDLMADEEILIDYGAGSPPAGRAETFLLDYGFVLPESGAFAFAALEGDFLPAVGQFSADRAGMRDVSPAELDRLKTCIQRLVAAASAAHKGKPLAFSRKGSPRRRRFRSRWRFPAAGPQTRHACATAPRRTRPTSTSRDRRSGRPRRRRSPAPTRRRNLNRRRRSTPRRRRTPMRVRGPGSAARYLIIRRVVTRRVVGVFLVLRLGDFFSLGAFGARAFLAAALALFAFVRELLLQGIFLVLAGGFRGILLGL